MLADQILKKYGYVTGNPRTWSRWLYGAQLERCDYMRKAALLMKPDCRSAKWWKAAKELTGQAGDVKGVPPLQDTNGSFVYDEKGKAALLNGTFISQCATVSEPMPLFGPTVTNTTFNFQSVHMSDITRIIQRLPEKHSSGPNGISYIMRKL